MLEQIKGNDAQVRVGRKHQKTGVTSIEANLNDQTSRGRNSWLNLVVLSTQTSTNPAGLES